MARVPLAEEQEPNKILAEPVLIMEEFGREQMLRLTPLQEEADISAVALELPTQMEVEAAQVTLAAIQDAKFITIMFSHQPS